MRAHSSFSQDAQEAATRTSTKHLATGTVDGRSWRSGRCAPGIWKPRTLVLYVTVFGLRRCRYPRSTSLRTPHTGGIASRVTPVSRAACSYPGHLQFHVHVPEGLKPGTQSRFCCSTLHAVSACRRWKPKAGHISPQNSSPLACSGIISLAARCTALLTVLCSPWTALTQPLSLSSLSQDQPGTRRSRPFDHSVRANSELDAARAPARRLV